MNRITLSFAALALAALVGCNTSPPGGTGGEAGKAARSATFTLQAPAAATDVKQGEEDTVRVTVDRGRDFKESVTLKAQPMTAGLTVEPAELVATADGDQNLQFKVSAAQDAPAGDHTVRVTGTPETGVATSVDVKVTVRENK